MPKAYSYIRMSTERQLKGDSLRRQAEASHAYARANNLELDEEFSLQDIGVSAFRGANLKDGALGKFLEVVRAGKIQVGSYLLVESFDRLSREAVNSALSLFLDITNSGINLVTLVDGRVYEAGKAKFEDLIYSIVVMSRAHEESLIKSHRLSAAWGNKRAKAGDLKMTRQAPKWLALTPTRLDFEINEPRALIVRQIFDDCVNGMGNYSIAVKLNRQGVKPFGSGNGWQTSSINKLLSSRAVLGEFQPKKMRAGKAEPDGEPVLGYFPQIIEEGLFLRAQAARTQRRVGGRGRKGQHFSNLFSGIARCGYCGSAMHYLNKGPGPKGGKYLVCDNGRRRNDCDATHWRYEALETAVLAHVQFIDLQPVMASDEFLKPRVAKENLVVELTQRKLEAEGARERTFRALGGKSLTPFVVRKFEEIETEISDLEQRLDEAKLQLGRVKAEISSFYESKDAVKGLINRLQAPESEDLYEIRSAVAARLRSVLEEFQIFACGSGRSATAAQAARMHDFWPDRRFFSVKSKGGVRMLIYPNATDPYVADGRFEDAQLENAEPFQFEWVTGEMVRGTVVARGSEVFQLSEEEVMRSPSLSKLTGRRERHHRN